MGLLNALGTLFSIFNKTVTGSKVGGSVATGLSIAALIPVAIGLFKWFEGNKDAVFIELKITYGVAIFIGLVVWGLIELIRAVRPRVGP